MSSLPSVTSFVLSAYDRHLCSLERFYHSKAENASPTFRKNEFLSCTQRHVSHGFFCSSPAGLTWFLLEKVIQNYEVVETLPCLIDDSCPFKFRHRPVYVRLSQMTSEVFCVRLRGGMNNTVLAGRICALVLLINNVVLRWATQWRASTLKFANTTS